MAGWVTNPEDERTHHAQVAEGADFVVLEDPSIKATSPTLRMVSRFTGLVKLALNLVRQRQHDLQEAPEPADPQR